MGQSPGGQALASSERMWESDKVQTWIDSESSSLLLIESIAALADDLAEFALKLVESREDTANGDRAVAYLLSPNPIRDFPTQYKCPGATEVLQQISIQILRHITSFFPRRPWELLAEAVVAMQDARNSRDWFHFIGRLSSLFQHVDVVIDVQIMGAKWTEAKSWPQDIIDVFAPSNSTARLSVMFITLFPLSLPTLQGGVLRSETSLSQRGAIRQTLIHSLKASSTDRSSPNALDTHDQFRAAERQTLYFQDPSNSWEAESDETGFTKSTLVNSPVYSYSSSSLFSSLSLSWTGPDCRIDYTDNGRRTAKSSSRLDNRQIIPISE